MPAANCSASTRPAMDAVTPAANARVFPRRTTFCIFVKTASMEVGTARPVARYETGLKILLTSQPRITPAFYRLLARKAGGGACCNLRLSTRIWPCLRITDRGWVCDRLGKTHDAVIETAISGRRR